MYESTPGSQKVYKIASLCASVTYMECLEVKPAMVSTVDAVVVVVAHGTGLSD